MPEIQPNIFLSYSHLDRETVKDIRDILQANGITIMWDQEFRIGDRWEKQMQNNLKKADCVVICWSQNAANSSVVNHEFSVADYDDKQVGIALEAGIKFEGIAGSAHHERYYEWDDDSRKDRIKELTDRIKEITSYRNPKVSMDEILSFVRRVDRKPQANIVRQTLQSRLSANSPGCTWLVSANRFERPEEFVTRAANQLIPQLLKSKGIISEANDENYELELYKLDWPEGYRDIDEAMNFVVQNLKDKVPGQLNDDADDLGACIAATDTIAPTIYLELPLDIWRPSDKQVLEKLLDQFGNVAFDPAQPKYFAVFIAAEFDDEDDKTVQRSAGGLFSRFFGDNADIDDVFASLAENDNRVESLPTFSKIARRHIDTWYEEADEKFDIPADQKNEFRNKINEPYIRNDSKEEHYQVLAEPMQKALQRVFHGKKEE